MLLILSSRVWLTVSVSGFSTIEVYTSSVSGALNVIAQKNPTNTAAIPTTALTNPRFAPLNIANTRTTAINMS